MSRRSNRDDLDPKDLAGAERRRGSDYQYKPGASNPEIEATEVIGLNQIVRHKRPGHFRVLKIGALLAVIVCVMLTIGYFYLASQLPPLNKVTDYRPNQTTQVFSRDLELVGEFFKERRYVTPLAEIPPIVRQAFIAAEDSRFFDHSGVDITGIFRALLKNIRAGGVKQGGSTITQQVAKSLLLSPERTLARKLNEVLLAFRIERYLSKEDILFLYLNQIYLGAGAYGVTAGAKVFFGKRLDQITLAEAALMAGLPTAPSRDNPFAHFDRAKSRQQYVLKMMESLGYIKRSDAEAAIAEPIQLADEDANVNLANAPYFSEHVRRYLIEKYGEQALYTGGLRVFTTVDMRMQRAAQEAVTWNLLELDKRQGYRGAIKKLDDAALAVFIKDRDALLKKSYQDKLALAQAPYSKEPVKYLVAPKIAQGPPTYDPDNLHRQPRFQAVVTDVDDKGSKVRIALDFRADQKYDMLPTLLPIKTEKKLKGAPQFIEETDYMGHYEGYIPLALMHWARKPNPEVLDEYDRIKKPSQALKRGDFILVRPAFLAEIAKEQQKGLTDLRLFALEQEPEVQGAIVAMDPLSGEVRAMVGGYEYQKSEFNRAVQARRQPGSAFKPLLYSAALEKGYTPTTVILDAPLVFDDPVSEQIWRPKNYNESFAGEVLFRTALIKSHNIVTIKILQDIGLDYVIDYAQKLGITSPLAHDGTIALGSSVVTPFELVQSYSVFAAGGVKRQPVFIKKIVAQDDKVVENNSTSLPAPNDDPAVPLIIQLKRLRDDVEKTQVELMQVPTPKGKESSSVEVPNVEENEAPADAGPTLQTVKRPGQVIPEEIAYLMTHLLTEVVSFGTGYRARELGRSAAGKTGTTNDYVDAWFVGYTPDLVATAWVGYDEKKSLGAQETGTKAASPMWLKFMQEAMAGRPQKEFRVPSGITFVKIDPKTGKLAGDKSMERGADRPVFEAFIDGTQPQLGDAVKKGSASDIFLEE